MSFMLRSKGLIPPPPMSPSPRLIWGYAAEGSDSSGYGKRRRTVASVTEHLVAAVGENLM